jgi:hypothetical protein
MCLKRTGCKQLSSDYARSTLHILVKVFFFASLSLEILSSLGPCTTVLSSEMLERPQEEIFEKLVAYQSRPYVWL